MRFSALSLVLASAAVASADTRPALHDDPLPAASPHQAHRQGEHLRSILLPRPDERVNIYVELEGEPAAAEIPNAAAMADPKTVDRVRRRSQELKGQHQAVRDELDALGVEVTADLTRLANAIQVVAPRGLFGRIESLPGVVAIHRVPVFERSTKAAVPQVGAYTLWGSAGASATGKGVRLGIIDTGIDYLHAAFGGPGTAAAYSANDSATIEAGTFPTARVVGGYDFVGDAYTGSNSPHGDPDPLDCADSGSGWPPSGGHGSHVAGIAAGGGVLVNGAAYAGPYLASISSGTFSVGPGVAPEASLYALKIFGCSGSTAMVASAMDWAADPNNDNDYSDRLDVLNLSLGSSYGDSSPVDQKQITNLTKLGTSIVVAAGNDGGSFFVVGSPSTYTETISVASSNKTPLFLALEVTAPASIAGPMPAVEGDFTKPLADTGPLSGPLVATEPANACSDLANGPALSGKIALIDRGTCPSPDKVNRAAGAGALAVVVVDDTVQDTPRQMKGTPGIWSAIPGVSIRKADGDMIKGKMSEGVSVTMSTATYPKPLGAEDVSEFSSRGPRYLDMLLKPDLTAPGANINSVKVGSGSSGANMSGTSMACPVAAGGATLLRSYDATLSDPMLLKAVMMNTAVRLGGGAEAPVSVGGAGRMALDRAAGNVIAAAAADPAGAISISFGSIVAFDAWKQTRTVVLTNRTAAPLNVTASIEKTYELAGVTPGVPAGAITVPAHGTANVELTLDVDPAALPEPAPDPYTPATQQNMPRQFFVEISGHARFDVEGNAEAVTRVPYFASVRAASKRKAGTIDKCLAPGATSISIPIEGESKAKDPLTSAFELVATSAKDASLRPSLDLRAFGAATNFASAGSIAEASVYFAIVVDGDWTTPSPGQFGTVGVEIDVNDDGGPDYAVTTEAYSLEGPYLDLIAANLYDLGSGQVVSRRYANVFPRDQHDTQLFNNSVIILPVTLADLQGITDESAPLGINAYTEDMLTKSDWTETVTWDPTKVFADTAKEGMQAGTNPTNVPFFGGTDPVKVAVDWTKKGASPLPSVLLLHHSNVADMRTETIDLEAVGLSPSSDLSVTVTGPSVAEAGQQLTFSSVVSSAQGPARKVKLTWTGSAVLSATPSAGTCNGAVCELGDIAAGAQVTVQWTAVQQAPGISATLKVESADGCELNAPDNSAQLGVALQAEGAPPPDAGQPAAVTDSAEIGGGACNCGAAGRGASWPGAPGAMLGLIAVIARKRRSLAERQHRSAQARPSRSRSASQSRST